MESSSLFGAHSFHYGQTYRRHVFLCEEHELILRFQSRLKGILKPALYNMYC